MGKPKTTLAEKKESRLRTLTDEAIVTIRTKKVQGFTRGWLSQALSIEKDEAAPVISQLKKEGFIKDQTTNFGDFADPANRGKYFIVREPVPEGIWINGRRPGKKEWEP